MVALSHYAKLLETPDVVLTAREHGLLEAARGMLKVCRREQAVADAAALREQELVTSLRTMQKLLQAKPKKVTKPILEALLNQISDEIEKGLGE